LYNSVGFFRTSYIYYSAHFKIHGYGYSSLHENQKNYWGGFVFFYLFFSAEGRECFPLGPVGVTQKFGYAVSSYSTEFLSCVDQRGQKLISLRRFQLEQDEAQLLVDANALKTIIIKSACLSCSAETTADYENTNYSDLLEESMSSPYPLQNDGVIDGVSHRAVAVTIDMCPSKKGISQKVYDRMVQISQNQGLAFPIGVAMTKAWLETHPQLLGWIKNQILQGRLEVVWMNHSATHPYRKNQPLEQNFLLSPGTDFTNEVLSTELALIRTGITPSIFFRFPGLVSSKEQILTLANWGLVAVGSNAWLAKGEKALAGSIILIHGNQNEPAGEKLFLNYVESRSADIAWASITELLTLP